MTFVNGLEQKHHIFVELASGVPLTYLVDSFHNDLIDDLAGISADEGNPLVDEESLLSKLNFDCLDHLDGSHNVVKPSFLRLLAAALVHQNQCLNVSLELCGHVEASSDELSSLIQELCVLCSTSFRNLYVHHDIRIHLNDPLDQLDVVQIELHAIFLILCDQFLLQESIQIWWVALRGSLQWALSHQKGSWIDAKIIVKNNKGARFLQRPDLLV